MVFLRCGNCGRSDQSVNVEHVRGCYQVRTIEDVEALLDQPAPKFGQLLDGIAVCKRERRPDLRDQCIVAAISAVTGETRSWEVRHLAREAAVSQLERASEERLEGDVRQTADSLRSYRDAAQPIRSALENEAEILDHIALGLAQADSPALVMASSRLRRMKRSDLALVLASKAIVLDSRSAAPRTTRAASLVDLLRAKEGLDDAMAGEELEPSSYTSNAASRAHRTLKQYQEAIDWADKSITRDPESPAGYRTMLMVAIATEDDDLQSDMRARLGEMRDASGEGEWSKPYTDLLAARELMKTGDRSRGIEVLCRLAEGGYEPERRDLLELGDDSSNSRPPD